MPEPIRATYRVQMHRGFGFDAVADLIDYLADLGVSHVYLSPFLQAVPGSMHGYDVIDPTRINDDLGGASGYARLRRAAQQRGLGLVVDVVPNHLAIATPGNRWWWDVLENGPASRYASYFDVDWNPPELKLRDLVLVPILADHYGRVLERGEIQVRRSADGDAFVVHYGEHMLPVAPRTLDELLHTAAARCLSQELAAVADAYGALPFSTATDRDSVMRRHRGKEWLRAQLRRLCAEQPAVSQAIESVVAELNADTEALHALLERQNYRLAFWRTAERDVGYRRFFDINSLAGLRVEDDTVFMDTHALVLDWIANGQVDGLRIDHVDGLRAPLAYLTRLATAAPQAWVVVEKILEPREALRGWPVDGTTGYDFLNDVLGVFIDPAAEAPFTALYRELVGEQPAWPTIVHEKKHLVMQLTLASDVNRLTALLVDICERHRRHRDYTRHELHEALREVIACLPVYRTYVQPGSAVDPEDASVIDAAINAAKARRGDLDPALLDFLRELLTLRMPGRLEGELVSRFQQLTGAVTAKGVEDTALYCFNRFIGLNEVGGDPQRFGVEVTDFHARAQTAQARWPRRMVTTSTHDTKRSEDVRARLALLTEIPDRWAAAVRGWTEMNEHHRRNGVPERNIEYFFYQTLVGAWPLERDRAEAYLLKAVREAKVGTSWNRPDETYEAGLLAFVAATLEDPAFRAELEAFVTPLIMPGHVNALAQTLVKLTAPGIPDLYQGTELWHLSLVDPDNRRPVNFARRRELLAALDRMQPEDIWNQRDAGLPKLWLVRQALAVRREHPQCFGPDGAYVPFAARGRHQERILAFQRAEQLIAVVPRLAMTLRGNWEDTAIELVGSARALPWQNVLTGERLPGGAVPVSALFRRFPVALLVRR
jgi:(1->4)-alpha-D-glucan 1-alpha-D-glucosylmutase